MFDNQTLLKSGLSESKAFRYFWAALALFSFGLVVYSFVEMSQGAPEIYPHQRASRLLIPLTNLCLALSGVFRSSKLKVTFSILGFLMAFGTLYVLFGNKS